MTWTLKMANNYTLQSEIRSLQLNIFRSHDAYLCEAKSPNKLRSREILEGFIKEFISLIPHKEKFSHPKFHEVLRRSIQKSDPFCATDTAEAWIAISTYASNLYTEPWRTEYREIRLYSGFYEHHIKNYLHGAESVLELIGYKLVDGCKMVLPSPPSIDDLTNISLNALVAACECQVLLSIYEEVVKHLPQCTYLDILSVRENYVCSVDAAIRCILSQCAPLSYCVDCMYPYTSSCASNCCRKCVQSSYLTNGYRNCYSNNVPYPSEPTPYTNGHCNQVPTDKLIDIDDPIDSCSSYRYNHWNHSEPVCKYPDRYTSTDSQSSFKEDYLRKFDEKSYHKKSLDVLDKYKSERGSKNSTKSNHILDSFNHLAINSKSEINNFHDVTDASKSNISKKRYDNDLSKPKSNRSAKHSVSKSSKKIAKNFDWECVNCTYRNNASKTACEMCGKSKNFVEETPLISGGKQCQKCTLVNKKDAVSCAACGENLSGCSHYV